MAIQFTFVPTNYFPVPNFNFGNIGTISYTLDNVSYSFSGDVSLPLVAGVISYTLDDVSYSTSGTVINNVGTSSYTLDNVSTNFVLANNLYGNISYTLDDVVPDFNLLSISPVLCDVSYTLDDVSHNFNLQNSNTGTLSYTLEDVIPDFSCESVTVNSGSLSYTLDDVIPDFTLQNSNTGRINYTLDDVGYSFSGQVLSSVDGTVSYTLEDVISNFNLQNSNTGRLSYTLDNVIPDFQGDITTVVNVNYTLDNVTTNFIGYLEPTGTLSYILDNVTPNITLEFREPPRLAGDAYTGENFVVNNFRSASPRYLTGLAYTSESAKVLFKDTVENTFDLGSDACCSERPKVGDNFNFEMGWAEYPDSNYHSHDSIRFSGVLATRVRLTGTAYTGENASVIDNRIYFEDINAWTGETLKANFEYNEKHRLCLGNFIPESESIIVELIDVLSESCLAFPAYFGETGVCNLSTNLRFAPNFYTGESVLGDISLTPAPPPLAPSAFTGEYAQVNQLNSGSVLFTGISAYTGEVGIGLGFYNPPVEAFFGETATGILTYKIGVELIDSGCLDNEYKYVKPSGDEDKSKFTRVAIELYPYQHFIKGKCIK